MRPFFSSQSEESIILLYLGSGSVRVGLAVIRDRMPPLLVHSASVSIPFSENIDYPAFERAVLTAALDSLITVQAEVLPRLRAARATLGIPQKMLCVLGSVWYASQTKLLTFNQQKSFLVTTDLLDKLSNEAKDAGSHAGALLEQGIMRAKVNGYVTAEPVGKRGREVELAVYTSFVNTTLKQKLEEIAEKVFHIDHEIRIHSQSIVSFTVLRDLFQDVDDFIVIDVSAEATEISLVSDQVLVASSSFPMGTRTIARTVAKETGLPLEELPGKLAAHLRSGIDFAPAAGAQQVWQKEVADVLSIFRNQAILPPSVYLSAEESYGALLANGFASRRPVLVTPSLFRPVAEAAGDTRMDGFLLSMTAFAARLPGKGTFSSA